MRTPFIAGNWKMFKTVSEAASFVTDLRAAVAGVKGVQVIVGPPFTALHAAVQAARGSNIEVAAQNLHWEKQGAFTGEISAAMIKEAGATYVIIGHSERRQLFGENDTIVNRKVQSAIAQGLTPILCIGETLDEREHHETLGVLDRQIKGGLEGITSEHVTAMIVAYEPVWAIGTGRNATAAQAGEAHAHIRTRLRQWFGGDAADRCRVIYGGSVKPDNIRSLIAEPDVDGALVGGASLDVKSFADIVKSSEPTK